MISCNDFDLGSDDFTRKLIRRKAAQMIGQAGIRQHDRDDLMQDLYLRIIESLPTYEPARSHIYSYIATVVERHVATILRRRRAAKRGCGRTSSLDEIPQDDVAELAQTVSDRELDARLGRERHSDQQLAEAAMDLSDLLATLPEKWQRLLDLRKSQTMEEVAQEMGVPRTTLNDWVSKIRKRFEAAGLENYFHKIPSNSERNE